MAPTNPSSAMAQSSDRKRKTAQSELSPEGGSDRAQRSESPSTRSTRSSVPLTEQANSQKRSVKRLKTVHAKREVPPIFAVSTSTSTDSSTSIPSPDEADIVMDNAPAQEPMASPRAPRTTKNAVPKQEDNDVSDTDEELRARSTGKKPY
jgi:hypothetical protein